MRLLIVDASVVIDLLARFDPAPLEAMLFAPDTVLAAPALLDVEVLQVFRRLERTGAFEDPGATLLDDLRALPIERYAHRPLLPRVWARRTNLTAYDATYVALAEALGASLVTRDRRLAAAPLDGVEVLVP
ncbi:MAG: type II toxin-antitoxin system VapC family toxin [Pseudomonadales bacterium]|jgi:predicted nucleic acid-binding protein|nr:type II toxin-antitoxin system VapC family toxin [Pseudomonadales bacterium]